MRVTLGYVVKVKRDMMNRTKLAGFAIVAGLTGLTLVACDGAPGDNTATKQDSVAAVETPSAEPEETKKDGPVVAQLGSKGLVFDAEMIDVAISKPGAYKPSTYAERIPKGEVAFVVTVEIINRNAVAIKPDLVTISASVGKDSAEAEAIFDTDAGLKGTPSTALLPGKTVKFKYGFHAPTTEKNPSININVSPWDLGLTTGLFAGTL